MKKPGLDLSSESLMGDVKLTLDILTGRTGGKIVNVKGIDVPYPSVGIDVAAAAGTPVTTKAEFDQLVRKVADIEAVLLALISRFNTP